MLKNIEAVIFDLDGTLVDSMWMWKKIDIEYLGRFQIPLPDNLQKEIEGMSFSETAVYFKERFNLEDSLEKIKADWTQMAYDKYRNEVPFKKGAIEFLKKLRNQGIKTGIATSNAKDLAQAVLEHHAAERLFDSIHTSCEVSHGKPAPDIYLLVADDLKVKPKNCLVFEDIPNGILAGKNAGMKVCAIYDDFSKEMDLEKKELADYFINDYEELL